MADDSSFAVESLWRYPVKSMLGEEIASSLVTTRGLFGDRAWALRDGEDGKVATAKNPRKWPSLFAFKAALDEERAATGADGIPWVVITLPDGSVIKGDASDVDTALSRALARGVSLERAGGSGVSEEYWPDIDGLDFRDTVTDFELPEGTFFDCASVLLLTTATLRALGERNPAGRFEAPRFRPNVVIDAGAAEGFVENGWLGRTLAIGDDVRLEVTRPCGRCVMTTLAQGDLPRDTDILRSIVKENGGRTGVYAAVLRGGTIRRGDAARLE
jgi:uncharacterized protein YcbX